MTPDILKLTQWLSPAFPVGGYAYSHGLEQAISDGRIANSDALQNWLGYLLRFGSGQSDAVLLACTLRGEDVAAEAVALCAARERFEETQKQGAAFAEAVSAISNSVIAPAPLPVVVGVAARGLALSAEQVIALYLHAFSSNLVSAAVRFVPLGQTDGQRVLTGVHPVITELAAWAANARLTDIGTSALASDLAAMQHETLNVRIFKT